MAVIPTILAWLVLVAGVATFVIGVAVGRGAATVETLLYSGMGTLILQFFAALVTTVHGRLLDAAQPPS